MDFKFIAFILGFDVLAVIILGLIRGTIESGEYSYGHTGFQAYILYILLFGCITVFTGIPYYGYTDCVRKNYTRPKQWKLICVTVIPSAVFLCAMIITTNLLESLF